MKTKRRKSDQERKTKTLQLRVTESDYRAIEKVAVAAGVSISEAARQLIEDGWNY